MCLKDQFNETKSATTVCALNKVVMMFEMAVTDGLLNPQDKTQALREVTSTRKNYLEEQKLQ